MVGYGERICVCGWMIVVGVVMVDDGGRMLNK